MYTVYLHLHIHFLVCIYKYNYYIIHMCLKTTTESPFQPLKGSAHLPACGSLLPANVLPRCRSHRSDLP